MGVRYTLEDLRTALAHSIGPMWWSFNGPTTSGYSDIMAMREAGLSRWLLQKPEDTDAEILRAAYRDLEEFGYFKFENEEDIDDEGD